MRRTVVWSVRAYGNTAMAAAVHTNPTVFTVLRVRPMLTCRPGPKRGRVGPKRGGCKGDGG
eukprot:1195678-Prorocentrum_minimum.AAC.4